jgi:hypothetical protein
MSRYSALTVALRLMVTLTAPPAKAEETWLSGVPWKQAFPEHETMRP